jgi:hypothetical protein
LAASEEGLSSMSEGINGKILNPVVHSSILMLILMAGNLH